MQAIRAILLKGGTPGERDWPTKKQAEEHAAEMARLFEDLAHALAEILKDAVRPTAGRGGKYRKPSTLEAHEEAHKKLTAWVEKHAPDALENASLITLDNAESYRWC